MIGNYLQWTEECPGGFGRRYNATIARRFEPGFFGGTVAIDADHLEAVLFGPLEAVVGIINRDAEAASAITHASAVLEIGILLTRFEVAIERRGIIARPDLAVGGNLVAGSVRRAHSSLRRDFQSGIVATLVRHSRIR